MGGYIELYVNRCGQWECAHGWAPGSAKTRAIKTLSQNLESEFSRLHFAPDLLPSDTTGSEIYLGEQDGERFAFQPGPIFSNLVLADEINRAPAKVQAAP
jgi:MoxR-like ATPase